MSEVININDFSKLRSHVYKDGYQRFSYPCEETNQYGTYSDSIYMYCNFSDYRPLYDECVRLLISLGYEQDFAFAYQRFINIRVREFYIVINIKRHNAWLSITPPLMESNDVYVCDIVDFIEYCNELAD